MAEVRCRPTGADVARIYTPKDFDRTRNMDDIVEVAAPSNAAAA